MRSPKIAIIGAGPAGCMLARLLHLGGIEAAVFELEASPNYRSQGGTLDLHEADGLAALKDAGLYDAFLEHARWDGEALAITDKHLKAYLRLAPTAGDGQARGNMVGHRPEIDRAQLRRILTESLPEGMIRWGRKLRRVEADGTLVFVGASDGSGAEGAAKKEKEVAEETRESGFDLVVGADGAWSKVRAALSDQRPEFTGLAHFEMSIPDAEHTAPEVYRMTNRGSVFAHSDGCKMSVQQLGDGSIGVYVNYRVESEDWAKTSGFDPYSYEAVRDFLVGEGGPFADFHPTLREAITRAAPDCKPRSMYQLPVGFEWKHHRGLTVIGDAAHLMTPFAGEGVNVALQDARMLAKSIRKAVSCLDDGADLGVALDKAIQAYETEAWTRAKKVTQLTDEVKTAWFFTPDVPRSVIARTTSAHIRYTTPKLVYPFAAAAVHSYFFVKNLVG